jgi:hypothetical protein
MDFLYTERMEQKSQHNESMIIDGISLTLLQIKGYENYPKIISVVAKPNKRSLTEYMGPSGFE